MSHNRRPYPHHDLHEPNHKHNAYGARITLGLSFLATYGWLTYMIVSL